jgi:hypothetical protein
MEDDNASLQSILESLNQIRSQKSSVDHCLMDALSLLRNQSVTNDQAGHGGSSYQPGVQNNQPSEKPASSEVSHSGNLHPQVLWNPHALGCVCVLL